MLKALKQKSFLTGAVFLIIGLVLIGISMLAVNSNDSLKGRCTATVTKVSTSEQMLSNKSIPQTVYKTYISYEVDGVSYENVESVTSTTVVNVGDRMQIAYNLENPVENTIISNTSALAVRICGYITLFLGFLVSTDYFLEKNDKVC